MPKLSSPMNCPDDKQLVHFLESGDSTIIIEHLTDCDKCRKRLESFAGEPIVRSEPALVRHTLEIVPDHVAKFPHPWDPENPTDVSGLIGEYQIVGKLGQGGMGSVFECEDLKLNRRVAIKTIRPEFLTPQILNRLEREARNQASLNHPNIVALYEFGSSVGWPYLVMELVRGRTLRDKIRDFPLAPRQAASVIAKLARALDYAHSKGVLHRDLKPSNILISDQPDSKDESSTAPFGSDPSLLIPKLSDFGLSIIIDSEHDLTRIDSILGTPAYMSPEQTLNSHANLTVASDVYSLGVVFYESITGRPPFQSDNVHQTLLLIQNEQPVSPRTLLPDLSRDLETICLKCLEKEPKLRYPSALALAEDLERYQNQQPIHARPVGPPLRLAKWCRRNGRLTAAIGVAIASLASLVVGSILVAYSQAHLRSVAEKNGALAMEQSRQARLAEVEARQQRDMAREQFVASSRALYNIGNLLAFSVFNVNPSNELKAINRQFQEQALRLSEGYLKRPDLAGDSPDLLPMSIYNAARAHRVLGHPDEAIRHYEWLLSLIHNSEPTATATESYRILAASGALELAEMYDARKDYNKAIALLEPFWSHPVNPQDNQPFPMQSQDYKRIRAIFGGKLLPLYQRSNQLEKARAMQQDLEKTTAALLQNP